MGYVCCEEMKLAQLCDAHITKSKEKFGQLFQIECPSPRLSEKGGAAQSGNVSNPEIEQTFNPMNGENF
ncbi:hypothetical protein FGO68_gene17013 [Halteria grandinella]|uniref:Uncharacterized protein n=1 Tax=Halteria grandinella TaxID=5974 RepID=A0A8J8NNV0_HALGN|nr:hypothetical protein FGO68_gene17013 [Halteria grandinella]